MESLRLDMQNAEAWHQLGLLKGGMERDAKQCLERSLELDDSSAQCWHDLGKNNGGVVMLGLDQQWWADVTSHGFWYQLNRIPAGDLDR